MKNILFTGGGGAGSEFVAKKWSNKYNMYFADADIDSIAPSIPDNKKVSIPMASDDKFLSDILSVCLEKNIDLLVPGVDEELLPLSDRGDEGSWPVILLPNKSFVETMLDKFKCFSALKDNNFIIPTTKLLEDAHKLTFPIIAKPRSGRGSRGVVTLQNVEQVKSYLNLYGGNPDIYIAQELIKGQEYTVFVSANKFGHLNAIIPIKVNLKKGITIKAETDDVAAIYEYIEKFQLFFQPKGIYNFQCMVDHSGAVMPFEINPRISTTFCLAISSGFDPIESFDIIGAASYFIFPEKKLSLRRSWVNFIS